MSFVKSVSVKPWERKGIIGGLNPVGAFDVAPEKVALSFFLLVVSIAFALLTVSYFIRMDVPDWTPLSDPSQLWFNTALLVMSSALFQWARMSVTQGKQKNIITAFVIGGVFAVLFIAGQLMAWQTLQNDGFFLTSNPANSFFYLLTGLHAIHLLGGLWVWSKSSIKLFSGTEPKELSLSIELCTTYWHFLLIVWLIMFGLLSYT
jgi:cytochrome c oxidase subunit 3